MQSPPVVTASTSSSGYTTIPISGSAVVSRSFQNLSTFISRRRPWPEFISSAGAFNLPDSLAAAFSRLRLNSKYFGVNYAILIATCSAVFLLGAPLSLIVLAAVFVLWLALHFFREDPLVVLGYPVSDQMVMIGLVVITVVAVWFTGILNNLSVGISVGLLISVLHGVFRNTEGLFLDENDALASGLIGSSSGPDSYRINISK